MTKKRWMLLILITIAAAIAGKSYYDTNVFQTEHVLNQSQMTVVTLEGKE